MAIPLLSTIDTIPLSSIGSLNGTRGCVTSIRRHRGLGSDRQDGPQDETLVVSYRCRLGTSQACIR